MKIKTAQPYLRFRIKDFFGAPKWVDSDQRFSKGGLGLPLDGDVSWRHSFCMQKLTQKFKSYRPKTDLKSRHVLVPNSVAETSDISIAETSHRRIVSKFQIFVAETTDISIAEKSRRRIVPSPNRPVG